eukprot:Skav234904  [mRNA]  locus=scaffold840:754271:766410:+ [translate_table: standard]
MESSRASTTQRGSKLKELVRTTQSTILHEEICLSDERLGVDEGGFLMAWATQTRVTFPPWMGAIEGHVHPASYVWTTVTTWFFGVVATLFIHQIRKAVFSPDLHQALTKLDLFVRDVGCGLDWSTMAAKERRRAVALWMLLALFFLGLQVIEQRDVELGLYDEQAIETKHLPLARQLSHVSAIINSLAFLKLGCSDGITGVFSVMLFSDMDYNIFVSAPIAMLPLVVLFGISARLLGEGGALTKKCEDVVVLRWQHRGLGLRKSAGPRAVQCSAAVPGPLHQSEQGRLCRRRPVPMPVLPQRGHGAAPH